MARYNNITYAITLLVSYVSLQFIVITDMKQLAVILTIVVLMGPADGQYLDCSNYDSGELL